MILRKGETYVGAIIINGSVVIASVTPLGSVYRIYQGSKWVFYTAIQGAGSATLRNIFKSAMLNGTISGGISLLQVTIFKILLPIQHLVQR